MSETLEKMKAAVEQLNESKEGQDVKDAINKIGAKDLKPIFQLDEDGNRLFDIVINYNDEG